MAYSNKRRIGFYKTGTPYERKRGDIPTFNEFHRLLEKRNIPYLVDTETSLEYILKENKKEAYYVFSSNRDLRSQQSHPEEDSVVHVKQFQNGEMVSPVVYSFTVKEVYYDRKWKSGLVVIEWHHIL